MKSVRTLLVANHHTTTIKRIFKSKGFIMEQKQPERSSEKKPDVVSRPQDPNVTNPHRFRLLSNSEISPTMSPGDRNARKLGRMAKSLLFRRNITAEEDRNTNKELALPLVQQVRETQEDINKFVQCYDNNYQGLRVYLHIPRSNRYYSMSLGELQSMKKQARELKEAADKLFESGKSAQELSTHLEHLATDAVNYLQAADGVRPLKHHRNDLFDMRAIAADNKAKKLISRNFEQKSTF